MFNNLLFIYAQKGPKKVFNYNMKMVQDCAFIEIKCIYKMNIEKFVAWSQECGVSSLMALPLFQTFQ
jgi:hypothetical protein